MHRRTKDGVTTLPYIDFASVVCLFSHFFSSLLLAVSAFARHYYVSCFNSSSVWETRGHDITHTHTQKWRVPPGSYLRYVSKRWVVQAWIWMDLSLVDDATENVYEMNINFRRGRGGRGINEFYIKSDVWVGSNVCFITDLSFSV